MLRKFTEFNGHYHDVNIKLLENFNNNLINEGLISSIEYEKAIQKLNDLLKKYKLRGNSHLYPYKDRIQLDMYGVDFLKNKKEFFDNFKSILNLMGYYISSYVIGEGDSVKKDLSFFVFNKNDEFTFWLNKKFDYEKGIPVELFHITYKRHIDKIKRQGLVPKSKGLIENHPDRIYLFFDEYDAENFTLLRDLYSDDDSDFILLKIDTRLLKNIKLYEDPKFEKDIIAFYTYDNIPPNSISIVREL